MDKIRTTAFKERQDTINKVNEIIDYLNNEPIITVDPEISQDSENPVQNKQIYNKFVETIQDYTNSIQEINNELVRILSSLQDLDDSITEVDNKKQDKLTQGNNIEITQENGIRFKNKLYKNQTITHITDMCSFIYNNYTPEDYIRCIFEIRTSGQQNYFLRFDGVIKTSTATDIEFENIQGYFNGQGIVTLSLSPSEINITYFEQIGAINMLTISDSEITGFSLLIYSFKEV